MNDFDDLVDEAERAPVGVGDFGWLDGRAVEDRPTWRYFDRVAERTAGISSLLDSLRSLSQFLMGPLPDASKRDTEVAGRAAADAGLVVQSMRLEHPRTAFYDIGAIVYLLRLVPWIVPGFTVSRYRDSLRELHAAIEHHGALETTASRTLVEATKPA